MLIIIWNSRFAFLQLNNLTDYFEIFVCVESVNVFQPPSQFGLMTRSSDGSSTQPTMDTRLEEDSKIPWRKNLL